MHLPFEAIVRTGRRQKLAGKIEVHWAEGFVLSCLYIHIRIYFVVEGQMATARVFKSGNSQAVRLPKKFRLLSREVKIFRRGNEIVLKEDSDPMIRAFDLLAGLPDDIFPSGRKDDPPQERQGME